ncbi:hypothetical protein D3C73_1577710 [compost metagenome]
MQRFYIDGGQLGERSVFMANPSHINRLITFQRDGNNVVTVQIRTDHPGRNGIAVQANEQIKKGRPIMDANAFGMR